MKYARIDSGRVAEIVTVPDGFAVGDCFAPAIVAALVPAGDGVAEGMAWDGHAFVAAPPPVEDRAAPIAAEIARLEARTIRPLGDALMYRAAGDEAAAEIENARVVDLRRQIAALRAGLA